MPRLLYHAPDTPDQESPFDRAIVQVIRDQDVKIVSPYISLEYLQRLIHMSRSWRLVSDVLEWLSATPKRERNLVYDFLAQHDGLIHHYPAIHAKTVLSGSGAYTGSANLTHSGVLRRTEFGVLLTDQVQVQEIHDWFDAIWLQTSPPSLDSVLELIAELNSITSETMLNTLVRPAQIDSGARRVRASLVKVLGYKPISLQVRQQIKEVEATRTLQTLVTELPRSTKPTDAMGSVRDDRTPVANATDQPLTHALAPATPLAILSVKTALESPPLAPALYRITESSAFDIEREVKIFVDRHAGAGFTFIQAHAAMRSLAHGLAMRDTYLALLEWCASHPRSLFSEDAVHRLVYSNGRFVQSNEAELQRVLEPMDHLVARILETLSFSEPTQLLDDEVRHSTPVAVFKMVMTGMIDAGFIFSGDGLRLIPMALWSQRLKLLKRAHRIWSARIAAHELSLATQRALETQEAQIRAVHKKPARVNLATGAVTTRRSQEESEALFDARVERLAQFDQVFAHLAWLYATKGEVIESTFDKLVADLIDASKLSLPEVKRLISGTYTLLRSPFAVMQTGHKRKQRIYHDLVDNPHLGEYPLTRQIIARSPSLNEVTHPPKPLGLPLFNEPAKRQVAVNHVKRLTLAEADDAYALICKSIFEHLDTKLPPTRRRDLLRLFYSDGIDPDAINKLLFATRDTRFNLFVVEHHGLDKLTLRLHHRNLLGFPKTTRYLEEQVWQSQVSHSWLPSLEMAKLEALKKREMAILAPLKKAKERDKFYVRMLQRIAVSILPQSRFKSQGDLMIALKSSGDQRIVFDYLLGVAHSPKDPLLIFLEDDVGYYLQLDPNVLPHYKRCMRLIHKMSVGECTSHSWLLNPSNAARIQTLLGTGKAPEKPPTSTPPVPAIKKQAIKQSALLREVASDVNRSPTLDPAVESIQRRNFPPLIWKDKTYLQLDTLYTDIARFFVKHGNPLKHSVTNDDGESVQVAALKKYAVVNNLRINAGDVIQPVLSLRMEENSKAEFELVIYKSYHDYKENYPKLQRLFYFTKLKLREV